MVEVRYICQSPDFAHPRLKWHKRANPGGRDERNRGRDDDGETAATAEEGRAGKALWPVGM